MIHWKFWAAMAISAAIIIVFQNCAGDFNESLYSSTTNELNLPIAPDTASPQIMSAPQNSTVQVGQSAAFAVFANGTNLTYIWKKDDQIISNATQNSLIVSNVQTTQAGSYTVEVSNSQGTQSASATLTVVPAPAPPPSGTPITAPVITTPPANQYVLLISGVYSPPVSATFSVAASGQQLTYAWFYRAPNSVNETQLSSTTNTLLISPVFQHSGGTYRVVVANSAGQVSASATLEVEVENYNPGPGPIPKPQENSHLEP